MSSNFKSSALLLSLVALTGCVSAAEGLLDGIANSVADVGSRTLYTVDEEACRVDPYWLAKKGVDLEFSKQRTFELANDKCQERFEVGLDEVQFAADFDGLLTQYCTLEDGSTANSTYCRNGLAQVSDSAPPAKAPFVPNREKMRGYEVGSLECDNDMFKRKMNVARFAQIDATEFCFDDGSCYAKANLVDRNRSDSLGAAATWGNQRGTSRSVSFTWAEPEADIEQVFIQTPEGFPLSTYTIEVFTPTGQQIQVAKVINEPSTQVCHRFNSLDVERIVIEGSMPANLGGEYIFLNEVVVR